MSDTLLDRLDGDVDPIELVSLLERLAQIDERRASILQQFRKQASSLRRREEERSIRQFVLRALDQIGVPQTTGFLEDYLYASELVEAKSRGTGALRRDEYRAWQRLRDRPRIAYIVPCLDQAGAPVARWLARSDWPPADRITVEGAEDLWALYRVPALFRAFREAGDEAGPRFAPLISGFAEEALGYESAEFDALFKALVDRMAHEEGEVAEVAPDDPPRRWMEWLTATVNERIATLESAVRPAQERAAAQLSGLSEEQLLWGRAAR